MRKINLILFASLALFGPLKPAHAWIFQEIPDKAVEVHYNLVVGAAVSTNTVLISLSSTTIWPHKENGELNLDVVRMAIDKVAASSATVRLGVLNMVNSSSGSVTWLTVLASTKNVSNTTNLVFANYLPVSIRCRVNKAALADTDGTTPYLFSNETTSASTAYQNDVYLQSPAGNILPGTGDIILQVVNNDQTNAINVVMDVIYHSNQR